MLTLAVRAVQDQLKNVQHIRASRSALTAVLGDGSVVMRGDEQQQYEEAEQETVEEQQEEEEEVEKRKRKWKQNPYNGCQDKPFQEVVLT